MKPAAHTEKLLRRTLRGRSRAELKRLFAAVRRHDDTTLLDIVAPIRRRRAKRPPDPLLCDIERSLKPLLAPASEKGDLLVEHLAKKHRRKLAIAPKGLADAVRQLRAKEFSDEQIRAGARSLMTQLARLYGEHETVV